jgi:hypothetical protein
MFSERADSHYDFVTHLVAKPLISRFVSTRVGPKMASHSPLDEFLIGCYNPRVTESQQACSMPLPAPSIPSYAAQRIR